MKLINGIKAYFYHEESKRSDLQLAQDFGEFPPSPLICSGLDQEFVIVRTRQIGGLFVIPFLLKRLFQVRHTDEITPSLHGIWRETQLVKRPVAEALLQIRNSAKKPVERIVLFLVIAPLLLVASLVWVPRALFKLTLLLINLYRHAPQGVGYFLPTFTQEAQIIIKADLVAKRGDGDSIIAHEHIHLLQHRNEQSDDKKSRCADVLLGAESKTNVYVLYLLEKNEVEARLHEIVLSYYRLQKSLPLTLDGFIHLLSRSESFGSLVIEAAGTIEPSTAHAAQYPERNVSIGNDFVEILSAIEDQELRRRFITEVLPVMYGNLIKHYGDETSSKAFLQGVRRPNLYDALYPHK